MSALAERQIEVVKTFIESYQRINPGSFVRRHVMADELDALLRAVEAESEAPPGWPNHGREPQ